MTRGVWAPTLVTRATAEVPGSKETRVGVSKGNLDEDLRPGRRASPCMMMILFLFLPSLGLADAHVTGNQPNRKS